MFKIFNFFDSKSWNCKFQFQNFMKSDKATSRSGQQYAIWWVIGLYLIIIAIARFCCAHECNDNVKIRKKLMPFECFYYSQTIISKHCDEIDARPLQKQRTYQARKVFKFKRGKTVNNCLWMCPSTQNIHHNYRFVKICWAISWELRWK